MAKQIVPANKFQPDFGVLYDREFNAKLAALPEAELFKLAAFKAWLDAQIIEITRELLTEKISALGDATKRLAIRYWVEKNADIDPIQFGWTLESWREVMELWNEYTVHCILGGNRSSKSVLASRIMVWMLLNIPEAQLRCYHVNDDKSIDEQQKYIWEALPASFKNFARRRNDVHSIQYTQKNGFTGKKLIVPPLRGCTRGGQILFGTYQQYKNDPQSVEGWWAHGIWCDEEAPPKMFERLLTRLIDARGRMILTFTTIQGWTPLVADLLGRTKTIRKRHSKLLNRELPVSQVSLSRPSTRIHYFWTEDNPFIPSETIEEKFKGRPEDEILATAYGIPSKPALSPFPAFDDSVHVIAHEKLPWLVPVPADLEEPEFTRYHIIDPSGSKPWFMLWAAVDVAGKVYVYREWPDESHGAWGEVGETMTGRAGPAQKPNKWGINDYVELIHELEKGETVFERLIDPRLGNSTTQAKEGATSIVSELDEAGIVAVSAPGLHVDHGIALIKSLLTWDASKPITSTNTPKLFISDRCFNFIEAMRNYTGAGGKDEVWKDPIDCLRYLLEAGADFIGKADLAPHGNTFSY